MSDELCLLPATELRARIVRKEVSPVEITRAVLARAERMQPELNCFITLCGDEAMAEAKQAEREVMAGAAGPSSRHSVHCEGYRQHQGGANDLWRGALQGQRS